MAIGQPATEASLFDVGIDSKFREEATFEKTPTFQVAPVFVAPTATLLALGIRVGTFSLSRSTWAADTNYTYAVTFDTALPAAPTAVLVGFLRSGSGLDAYSTGTTGYTTTGFTFNISRNAARSTATDFTLVYIAI